jgi:hypothetical protein
MTKRSAPKGGYDTEEKQKYREAVWAALLPAWEACKIGHVLLLPSSEGVEIDYVISLGVPPERIIAIDKSAAVIATSKWRKKHPTVKFMATTIGECGTKLLDRGIVLAAANLDFCSNFCEDLIEQYHQFLQTAPQFSKARVAVTVAKGRESTATALLLKKFAPELSAYDEPRLAALMAFDDYNHLLFAQGAYKSGSYPMAWAVRGHNYVYDEWLAEHLNELDNVDVAAAARALQRTPEYRLRAAINSWIDTHIAVPAIRRYNATLVAHGAVEVRERNDRAFAYDAQIKLARVYEAIHAAL